MPTTGGHAIPEDVGSYYDLVGDTMTSLLGDNLHLGLWSGPDDDSSISQATDRMTDTMFGELGVHAGQRVLDVGCGTGRPAVRLATTTGAHVVGITLSHRQIELATKRAATAHLADQVRFEYADAMALPFPAASFDAAMAIESIVHMPDRRQVLREIARVLKPGGRLVLSDVVRRVPELTGEQDQALTRLYEAFRVADFPSLDEYPRIVREGRFALERLTDVGDNSIGKTYALLDASLTELRTAFGHQENAADSVAAAVSGGMPEAGYILVTARSVPVS